MTDKLFNRDFAVQIGTLKISARLPGEEDQLKPTLRVAFEIRKSINSEPNEANIQIYNLSESNRKLLQKKDAIIVEAGYTKTLQQVFSGDVTLINYVNEEVDWVTTIESGDGSKEYRNARMNTSFRPGTSVQSILEEIAKSTQLNLGNSLDKFNQSSFRKGMTEFSSSVVLNGKVSDLLDKYVATAGFQWSIQDKALQVLEIEETTEEELVVLNAQSGLVGSPEIGEKGVVTARSLLQGEIKPGRRIKIESKLMDGFFKIETVTHIGDTWGDEWYSEIEAKPI